MTLAPCPVGRLTHPAYAMPPGAPPCGTMLQPYRGRLSIGVTEHLKMVHGLPEAVAGAAAAAWIKAGCRAKG